MSRRHAVAIHRVDRILGGVLDEVRGDLVAVEVEIDPALGLAADGAAEGGGIKITRGFEVVHRERQVKTRSHAPSSQSRGCR